MHLKYVLNHPIMKKIFLIALTTLAWSQGFGQNVMKITGNVVVSGSADIVLNNTQLINDGAFDTGAGTVHITGDGTDAQSAIGGASATTFYKLKINKSANGAQLGQSIQVDNELQMTAGNLDLNGHSLALGGAGGMIAGESASSYIHGSAGGEVVKTTNLNAPNAANPGNIGASITSAADLGSTTIRRRHQPQSIYGADGILRYYEITPTNNDDLNATLRLSYLDHELNSIPEADLEPLRELTPSWHYYAVSGADGAANYVEAGGINAFSKWTLAAGAVKASPRALLQGPYAGSGLMNDLLRPGNLLPDSEPYSAEGYAFAGAGGGETLDTKVFNITGNDAIVDWVIVELRDKNDPTAVLQSRAALLQRDGDIVGLNGKDPVSFPGGTEDDYYLAVLHRNHLGIRSAGLVNISLLGGSYDFSTSSANTLGGANGIATLADGYFGLFSGDFNGNGQVQNTDVSNMVPTIGNAGYLPGDHNLNGQVQNTDLQLQLIPNLGRGAQFSY